MSEDYDKYLVAINKVKISPRSDDHLFGGRTTGKQYSVSFTKVLHLMNQISSLIGVQETDDLIERIKQQAYSTSMSNFEYIKNRLQLEYDALKSNVLIISPDIATRLNNLGFTFTHNDIVDNPFNYDFKLNLDRFVNWLHDRNIVEHPTRKNLNGLIELLEFQQQGLSK